MAVLYISHQIGQFSQSYLENDPTISGAAFDDNNIVISDFFLVTTH